MDLNNSPLLEVGMCEVSVNTEKLKTKKSIRTILDQLLQKKKKNFLGLNRLKKTESKSPPKLLRVKSRNVSYVPYRNTPKPSLYSEHSPYHHHVPSLQSEFHLPKIAKIKIKEMRITPNSLQSLNYISIAHSPYRIHHEN